MSRELTQVWEHHALALGAILKGATISTSHFNSIPTDGSVISNVLFSTGSTTPVMGTHYLLAEGINTSKTQLVTVHS